MTESDLKEIIAQLLDRIKLLEYSVFKEYSYEKPPSIIRSNDYIKQVLDSNKEGE